MVWDGPKYCRVGQLQNEENPQPHPKQKKLVKAPAKNLAKNQNNVQYAPECGVVFKWRFLDLPTGRLSTPFLRQQGGFQGRKLRIRLIRPRKGDSQS